MRLILRILFAIAGMGSLLGCATNARDRVYQNMALGALSGVAVGQSQETYKNTYSTMYAGIGAAIAAAVTLYMEDPYKEAERLRAELKLLTGKAEQFENGKLVNQGPATFGAKVPEKYKAFINPGEWRIYELDQWVESDDNRLIHQDKMMELIPPSLNPGN